MMAESAEKVSEKLLQCAGCLSRTDSAYNQPFLRNQANIPPTTAVHTA